jgi:hypothetical protein
MVHAGVSAPDAVFGFTLPAGKQVHAADELPDRPVPRRAVNLFGRADLQDPAVVHHDDAVGHRQGLVLVVGDQDGGQPQPLLDLSDFTAEADADRGVQGGQRLVKQQQRRVDRQGAGECDPLLLSARKLGGELAGDVGQADQIEQFDDPA